MRKLLSGKRPLFLASRLFVALSLMSASAYSAAEDEFDEMDEFYMDEMSDDSDVPVVLTVARLKQPKNEAPASVTVIEQEQISAWGVRKIYELMRFVPGMFLGHGDELNNTSVIYHVSDPNVMRRMQVLVDGRSVYKSAISDVIWEDIPIAMEDIDRIEVVRGPNGATFGANAFLAVINIISKHPDDTLGTRVTARKGSDGIRDVQLSSSHRMNKTSFRVTGQASKEEGFDGHKSENGKDIFNDGRNYHFVNSYITHEMNDGSSLDIHLAYKHGDTQIRPESVHITPPDKTSDLYAFTSKWQKEFSESHKSHLMLSVQKESTESDVLAEAPALVFDPKLRELYGQNPLWARAFVETMIGTAGKDPAMLQLLGYVFAGAVPTADALNNALTNGVPDGSGGVLNVDPDSANRLLQAGLTDSQFALAQQVLLNTAPQTGTIAEAQINLANVQARQLTKLDQQKVDIEWQDTIVWSDEFTTVSGISYRNDEVHSDIYFDGRLSNHLYRVFVNGQYRLYNDWLFNLGATYEVEDSTGDHFSPRLAVNYLLDNQQSLRFVVAQAFRTPDLLEKKPDYSVNVTEITDNYLGIDSGTYYAFQKEDIEKDLTSEKVVSYELGYYLNRQNIELDIKVFYERVYDIVSGSINLYSQDLDNSGTVNIDGIELNSKILINKNNYLWLSSSYVNAVSKARIFDEAELTVLNTSENNNTVSWITTYKDWSASVTSYSNFTQVREEFAFERMDVALKKKVKLPFMDVQLSVWNQRNFRPESRISYRNQVNSERDIYYFGISSEF